MNTFPNLFLLKINLSTIYHLQALSNTMYFTWKFLNQTPMPNTKMQKKLLINNIASFLLNNNNYFNLNSMIIHNLNNYN